MKVGVLTSVRRVSDTRIFYKMCRSLVRAGYEVTYIVPYERDVVIDGVCIRGIPKPKTRWIRMTRTPWTVYREAIKLDAAIYSIHDAEMIPVGLLLRIKGKKVVYNIHDDVTQALLTKDYIPQGLRRPLSMVVACMENMACRFFSGLIPASSGLAEKYRRCNKRTVAVANFVDSSEMPLPLERSWEEGPFAVAYIGMLEEERQIRQLVMAMGLLPKQITPLLKLGGIFASPLFREHVVSLPEWKYVEELGYLNRGEIIKTLGASMVGILFLADSPSHLLRYGSANKLFDYMAAALPIVATDFPLWRDIIKRAGCGLLINSNDPHAIAEAISYLLLHPKEADAMGRRGREAVDKWYRWEDESKKLIGVFNDIAKS